MTSTDDLYLQARAHLDAGLLDEARSTLTGLPAGPDRSVLELYLQLLDASASADSVMDRLVQLMRKHPAARGARDIYQLASREAYGARSSSMSHSHPYLPAQKIEKTSDD